jgi:hypothetical protein
MAKALGAEAHAALAAVNVQTGLANKLGIAVRDKPDSALGARRLRPGAEDINVVGGKQDNLVDPSFQNAVAVFLEARQVIAVARRRERAGHADEDDPAPENSSLELTGFGPSSPDM